MMQPTVRTLEGIDIDKITDIFEAAFADYAVSFSRDEIKSMLRRRGYSPEYSYGVFDRGSIVAFALSGKDYFAGKSTVYDIATAAMPDYRGRGLSGLMFSRAIPELVAAGVERYLLEVLCNNEAAIKAYRKQGFAVGRTFLCHRQACTEVISADINVEGVNIKPLVPSDDILADDMFCDFTPSWQNSRESILRASTDFKAFGAYHNDMLVGYTLFDARYGDLTRIAVREEMRRKGIGSMLLNRFLAENRADAVKVLNIESTCSSLAEFLKRHNINEASRQYEMYKELST